MKIPNFDDVDLSVICITVIALFMAIVIGILLLLGVDPEKIIIGMGFGGMAISAIAGLARGKPMNGNEENQDPSIDPLGPGQ